METVLWVCIIVVACLCLVPVILFRPLLLAIANRIAGKHGDSRQMQLMEERLAALEAEIGHLHARLGAVEETGEFSRRLLEDLSKKTSK